MKTSSAKGKISSFVSTAPASTTGQRAKWQKKVRPLPQNVDVDAWQTPKKVLRESKQSLQMIFVEESLDFTGVDTSERLGAVRLRKV